MSVYVHRSSSESDRRSNNVPLLSTSSSSTPSASQPCNSNHRRRPGATKRAAEDQADSGTDPEVEPERAKRPWTISVTCDSTQKGGASDESNSSSGSQSAASNATTQILRIKVK